MLLKNLKNGDNALSFYLVFKIIPILTGLLASRFTRWSSKPAIESTGVANAVDILLNKLK